MTKDSVVHFVFPTQYLLDRDKEVFKNYWTMNKFQETRVEYHVGLNFQKGVNDLLVYDESDA